MYSNNLIDLSTFIKHDFIKDKFMESCLTINTIEEAETMAKTLIFDNTSRNFIFENSACKNQFLKELDKYVQFDIINCAASDNRINEDMDNSQNKYKVFDHINKCSNIAVLNRMNKENNIFIC